MLLFLFAAFFNSSANFLTKLMGHLTPVIQKKILLWIWVFIQEQKIKQLIHKKSCTVSGFSFRSKKLRSTVLYGEQGCDQVQGYREDCLPSSCPLPWSVVKNIFDFFVL